MLPLSNLQCLQRMKFLSSHRVDLQVSFLIQKNFGQMFK